MKCMLSLESFSQHDETIDIKKRPSACGPTTVHTILHYLLPNSYHHSINELYSTLGTTRIGLFTWRMVSKLRKLLGTDWEIRNCSIEEAIAEIKNGRPVAMKFDRYFTFQWFSHTTYAYHWVPLIGFEKSIDDITLYFHDNGGIGRSSVMKSASFKQNERSLTFVLIRPHAPFSYDT